MGELTSSQLSEWEAYDKIDPIGSWRADFRMAYICSLIINIHNISHTEKDKEPILTAPLDFLPIWDEEERERIREATKKKQSIDEMKQLLTSIANIHNNSEARKKGVRKPKINPPPKRK